MIRVDLMRRDIAVVICEPTIWERLFLHRTSERIASAHPDISNGRNNGRVWLYENGRPVSERVRQAIEAEVTKVEWDKIWGREAK